MRNLCCVSKNPRGRTRHRRCNATFPMEEAAVAVEHVLTVESNAAILALCTARNVTRKLRTNCEWDVCDVPRDSSGSANWRIQEMGSWRASVAVRVTTQLDSCCQIKQANTFSTMCMHSKMVSILLTTGSSVPQTGCQALHRTNLVSCSIFFLSQGLISFYRGSNQQQGKKYKIKRLEPCIAYDIYKTHGQLNCCW